MRPTFTTLGLLSIISVAPLAAQADPGIPVGTRVRITAPDTTQTAERPGDARRLTLVGELVAISDSTISLRNDATSDELTVPLSRVQRLEVSAGSNRGPSAGKGALIGLVLGGVLGFATGDDCSSSDFICFSREDVAAGGAVLGAAVGGVIGLIAGGGERWKATAIPRVSFMPIGSRSVSIASTLRF